ncbi:MAG: acyltransferase [Deltaproteobacteria bacterium]|nr:acyltransferase [Deltaproteobacteria bacterium]
MRPSRWLRRIEDAILRRLRPRSDDPGNDVQRRIDALRARGVRIGRGCIILTDEFSTEPYLIEIGDRVGIASGTRLVTHDGVAGMLRRRLPNAQVFGPIRVGDDTVIGINCIILPNTAIGSRCVVGAGSVVKGVVEDGTVVAGNPARVIKKTSDLLQQMEHSPNRLDILDLDPAERERRLKAHFGIVAPAATVYSTDRLPRRVR